MITLSSNWVVTTYEASTIEVDEAWVLDFALKNNYLNMEDVQEMSARDIAWEVCAEIFDHIEQTNKELIKTTSNIINGEFAEYGVKEHS